MSSEIDWVKATEYAERLGTFEKTILEKAKLFDPKKIVQDAKQVVNVKDPKLGILSYGHLTMEDLFEIAQETSNGHRNALIIFKMLAKAYPDVTLEDIKAMPVSVTTRLLQIFNSDTDFLPTAPASKNG